jgi:putative transposase
VHSRILLAGAGRLLNCTLLSSTGLLFRNPPGGSRAKFKFPAKCLAQQIALSYFAYVHIAPFTTLNWAYQLHYYLCFRTHHVLKTFSNTGVQNSLSESITEICQHHQYHELKSKVFPDHFRLVLSLRPGDVISKVVGTLKSNSARALATQSEIEAPVWGRGYLARSVGLVRVGPVKKYIERQAEHHGYSTRKLPPVYRFRAETAIDLKTQHAVTDLRYHLVFATKWRKGVFGSDLGKRLCAYWLRVAEKHHFAIDRCTFLPDHVHLMVRTAPEVSIEQCALSLLNNGQHYVALHAPELLVQTGIDQLWQGSAYAGTSGEYSTGMMTLFLSN